LEKIFGDFLGRLAAAADGAIREGKKATEDAEARAEGTRKARRRIQTTVQSV
jgi:hypothetical protein